MRKNIVALILEKDGKFLVEKRKSTAFLNPDSIVFPGGHVEDGETLEEAIKREAMEELSIELCEIKQVHEAEYDFPEEKQKLYWFWCENFNGEIKNNVAEELIWISSDQIDLLTYQCGRDAVKCLINSNKKRV